MSFLEPKDLTPNKIGALGESKQYEPQNGLSIVLLQLFMVVVGMFFLVTEPLGPLGLLILASAFFMLRGYFTVNPMEARLISIQGKLKGTVQKEGFYWVVPYAKFVTLSLRPKTFSQTHLTLYDKNNTALVLSFSVDWKISDPQLAYFLNDDIEKNLSTKIVSALHSVCALYPYKSDSLGQIDFKDGLPTINQIIEKDLLDRLKKIGIKPSNFRIDSVHDQHDSVLQAKTKAKNAIEQAHETILRLRANNLIALTAEEEKKLFLEIVVWCSGGK